MPQRRFDEYLTAVGVSYLKRKIAAKITPVQKWEAQSDGTWQVYFVLYTLHFTLLEAQSDGTWQVYFILYTLYFILYTLYFVLYTFGGAVGRHMASVKYEVCGVLWPFSVQYTVGRNVASRATLHYSVLRYIVKPHKAGQSLS